jgi:hypothetical protein
VKTCPICDSALESRLVAPCYDCGHAERELEELAAGEHQYHEFRAFGDHSIILCDFCDADFGSYYPSQFGLPDRGRTIGQDELSLVRAIDPQPYPIHDGYCPVCKKRLAYLKFLANVRSRNALQTSRDSD